MSARSIESSIFSPLLAIQQEILKNVHGAFHSEFGNENGTTTKPRKEKKPTYQEKITRPYVERFKQKEYETDTARAAALLADMDDVIREVSLAETITTYSYDIDLRQKDNAAHPKMSGEGYHEDVSVWTQTFVRELAKRGLKTFRGLTEKFVLLQIKNKLIDVALQQAAENIDDDGGYIIAYMSPPGPRNEGYHGSKSHKNWRARETHHTFFFVFKIGRKDYEIDEFGQRVLVNIHIEVKQYRICPNIQEALELSAELGVPITISKKDPITSQIIANIMERQTEPSETTADIERQTEEILYRKKNKWGRQPEQAPHIADIKKFMKDLIGDPEEPGSLEKSFIGQFYLPQALAIHREITPEVLADPKAIAQKVNQLELLFNDTLAAIEKHVQEWNDNPIYNEFVEEQKSKLPWLHRLTQPLRKLTKIDAPKPEPKTFTEKLPEIQQLHYLREKSIVFSQKLNRKEHDWYVKNASSFLELANFASGSAQCLLVAPFSMPMSILKNAEGLSGLKNFEASLTLFSFQENLAKYQKIKELDYVELRLPGAKRVYMVPRSYLDKNGCVVDEHGNVFGPCMDEEGNRIALDDPRDTMAFAKNQAEFDAYIQKLEAELHADELNELEKELGEREDLSPEKKERAAYLLGQLRQLVIRSSIGVEEFLTGASPLRAEAALFLPGDLFRQISEAPDPLVAMQQIIHKLMMESPNILEVKDILMQPAKKMEAAVLSADQNSGVNRNREKNSFSDVSSKSYESLQKVALSNDLQATIEKRQNRVIWQTPAAPSFSPV